MEKQTADQTITEYLPKLYGFAVKKSYSYSEAEELCSDIIHELYRSLLRAKEIVNMEGYIWRICEHTYAKYLAAKKKHIGLSLDGLQLPFYDDTETDDTAEELARLRREVAFLTQKRRRIVYLFYYENKPVSAIAEELALSEGTVKWHLNKARSELKEGFLMERKIGKLGLSPITALSIGHSGNPGSNGGPEFYLNDKLNLNIVYSVYHAPKTIAEIAEELGITPVFLEDRIAFLESNGFLVKTPGDRYTTYVLFYPQQYAAEQRDNKYKALLQAAEVLSAEYVPTVRAALAEIQDVYIPGGNRELFEATAVFHALANRCSIPIEKDLSPYFIQTTAGGEYITHVTLPLKQNDPDYAPAIDPVYYNSCGNMTRTSCKYPAVASIAIDSRLDAREGFWQNNLGTDYEHLYEILTGAITDDAANAEKFTRLRQRRFLTEDNRINILIVKDTVENFLDKLPKPDKTLIDRFAGPALEYAIMDAKNYPPQMQDLIISQGVMDFLGNTAAIMTMDILYQNGTFRPLTEEEKVTANLLMFSDILPA